MQCTPEQIEKKRRIALAKLQTKKFIQSLDINKKNNGPNLYSSNSNQNKSPNAPVVFKSPNSSNKPVNTSSSSINNVSNSINTNSNNPSNMINLKNNFPSTVNNSTSPIRNFSFNSSTNSLNNTLNSPKSLNSSYFNPNDSVTSLNSNTFQNDVCTKILPSSSSKPHNNTPYTKPGISPQNFFGKTVTGTMAMISETRFEVELSDFNEKAIATFRSIPSRIYNNNTKLWNFHIKDYTLLLNKLNALKPEVVVGRLPSYLLKLLDEPTKHDEDIDFSRIDDLLYGSLLPFQKEGVVFGINRKGRVLIADDMGLGKTFQALAIANYYKQDWPLLIVTTTSMRNTWQETIQEYIPSVPLMSVLYMVTAKDYINDVNVLIVSREMLTRCLDKLLERRFGVIIFDESHEYKNFKTKATKAATALSKIAKRVILLSGTPALSRPNELFTQLSLIDSKFFGDFIEYSKRYCDGKQSNFGWDSSGKSNLTELEVVLSKKFMIRRTKSDVLQSLPDKTREVFKLDLSLSELSKEEQKCLEHLINQYNGCTKGYSKHSALLSLFSETANIKIPAVCKYVFKIIQEDVKFLIFAHHQKMLDAICSILLKNKINFIRIDGSTTPDQRKYFIDKFQNENDCLCAVLSITAANAGITLTAAQLVLFAELHWNPSILTQAESRAHRIGQQNQVTVRYLIGDGTADDYIWPMLLEKQKVLNEAGLSKDSFQDVNVSVEKKTKKINQTTLGSWFNNSKNNDNTMPSCTQLSTSLLEDDNDNLFLDIDV